ncbi:hypothetical protein ACG7TL_001531 [Trametes sanguinea]
MSRLANLGWLAIAREVYVGGARMTLCGFLSSPATVRHRSAPCTGSQVPERACPSAHLRQHETDANSQQVADAIAARTYLLAELASLPMPILAFCRFDRAHRIASSAAATYAYDGLMA